MCDDTVQYCDDDMTCDKTTFCDFDDDNETKISDDHIT